MERNIAIFVVITNEMYRENIIKYYNKPCFSHVTVMEKAEPNLQDKQWIDKTQLMDYKLYNHQNKTFDWELLVRVYRHLLVYKKMQQENIPSCIIMEDSFLLTENYMDELDSFAKTHCENTDMIYLHSHMKQSSKRKQISQKIAA